MFHLLRIRKKANGFNRALTEVIVSDTNLDKITDRFKEEILSGTTPDDLLIMKQLDIDWKIRVDAVESTEKISINNLWEANSTRKTKGDGQDESN